MKRIACLQHVPFEGPGCLAKAFAECGCALEPRLVPRDGLPENPPDALLVLGGPMSVNDADSWIADETDYIREQVARGLPYLGICLGSQFLARAVEGAVRPGPAPEIGMVALRRTEAARHDPLFSHFPDAFDAFAWHGEGLHLPEGAMPLASSTLYPVQAFRHGRAAYGLLFHLEIEAAGVDALCRQAATDLVRVGRTRADVERETLPHLEQLNRMAGRMVRHFVDLIP